MFFLSLINNALILRTINKIFKGVFFLFLLTISTQSLAQVIFQINRPETGTIAFDANDLPGNDSSISNDIVRTLDTIGYQIDYNAGGVAINNPVLTMILPPQLAFTSVPAICNSGFISTDTAAPFEETLTCPLENISAATAGSIPISVKVFSQDRAGNYVVQGQIVTATASLAGEDSGGSPLDISAGNSGASYIDPISIFTALDTTVSAAPKFDLRMDAYNPYYREPYDDPVGNRGFVYNTMLTIETRGGKGSEPLKSPINITQSLEYEDPASPGTWLPFPDHQIFDWRTSGTNILPGCNPNYAPIASGGNYNIITLPYGSLTYPASVTRPDRSVGHSGSWSCSQPGGAGSNFNITLTGADTTGTHLPTKKASGSALPTSSAWLVSGMVHNWIPLQTILDAGGELKVRSTYTELTTESVSNIANAETNLANNTQTWTIIAIRGSFNNYYVKSVTDRTTVLAPMTNVNSGNGVVMPDQVFAKRMYGINNGALEWRGDLDNTAGTGKGFMMCEKIDNRTYTLEPLSTDPTQAAIQYHNGSNTFNYVIEYGTGGDIQIPAGGAGAADDLYYYDSDKDGNDNTNNQTDFSDQLTETCYDADSPGGWHTNINNVPGGIGNITKVRIRATEPMLTNMRFDLAINLKAFNNDPITNNLIPVGTWLPNFSARTEYNANYDSDPTDFDFYAGNYNPINHGGYKAYGDRLALTRAVVRIAKQTVPDDQVNNILSGNIVTFKLVPSLTVLIDPPPPVAYPVTIIDRLPKEFNYVSNSANIPPTSVTVINPGTANEYTEILWDLGMRTVNDPMPEITFKARAAIDVPHNTQGNNVGVIESSADSSSEAVRSDTRTVIIESAGSFQILKEVNEPLITPGDQIEYTLTYANLGANDIGPGDFIDILPYDADGGNVLITDGVPLPRDPPSSFNDSAVSFDSIAGTNGETFEYTNRTPSDIFLDPEHQTNLEVGDPGYDPGYTGTRTTWCTDFTGVGGCPSSAAEVTAIRILWPIFVTGDPARTLDLVLNTNNLDVKPGDSLTNSYGGRADGVIGFLGGQADPATIEIPRFGVAKDIIVGNLANAPVAVTYDFYIKNLSKVTTITNMSMPDDFVALFGTASSTSTWEFISISNPSGPASFSHNTSFDGETNKELIGAGSSLAPNEQAHIQVQLRVYQRGSYDNQVKLTAEDEEGNTHDKFGNPFEDLSNYGNAFFIDSDGDGNPNEMDAGGSDPDADNDENVPTPLVTITQDYGDAPDIYGDAEHLIPTAQTVYLGSIAPDGETNPQNAANGGNDGTGDDNAANSGKDDEDGVNVFPALSTTMTGDYRVNVSCNGHNANVYGWIDFNDDDDFADPGEFASATCIDVTSSDGNATLTFSGYTMAASIGITYARIRITTDTLTSSDSAISVSDGEVEDYALTSARDHGDAPDTYGDANHIIPTNPTIYLGSRAPDGESSHQLGNSAGTDADGDDGDGNDDEDGVTTFPALSITTTGDYVVDISCNGNGAKVYGWLDFNDDNDFTDAGEFASTTCADTGNNNGTAALTFSGYTVATSAGTTYVRIRITSDKLSAGDSASSASDGEVEDYVLTVKEVEADYGDAPDTYGDASHAISAIPAVYLGVAAPDSENDTQLGVDAGAGADGDDDGSTDDEDAFNSLVNLSITDTSYSLTVPCAGTATVAGWIDFDLSGIFTNSTPNEKASATCSSGNATLTWNSASGNFPASLSVGTTYVRLRTASDATEIDNPTGAASDGEVEDYQLLLVNPALSIGCPKVYASAWNSSVGVLNGLYELNGAAMNLIYTAPQKVGGLAVSSNGHAYYDNGTFDNPPLYKFDGTTQTNTGQTVPTLLVGETADLSGNVYYIDSANHLRKVVTGGSGAATDLGAIVFDSGDTIGPSLQYGDMTFDANGRLFWYSSVSGSGKSHLYYVNPTTLEAKNLGNIGPDGATGVAFNSSGELVTTTNFGVDVYTIDLTSPSLAGTHVGTASPSVYDLGSCFAPDLNAFIDPSLGVIKSVANITKSQTPALYASPNDILEYTITVTNTGNLPTTDATLADTIPTGTTYVASSTLLNGNAVADISGAMPFATANEINSSSQASGIITVGASVAAVVKFRVQVNAAGTPYSIDNQATVTYPTVNEGVTTTHSIDSNQVTTPTKDYGDAPDASSGTATGNYQTTESDGGPSHFRISGLSLGSLVDADDGTLQNSAASADNANGSDDEDAITSFPSISTTSTNYTLSGIPIVNNTGQVAYLVGWIDFNGDGDFTDTGEQSNIEIIPNGGTSADLSWLNLSELVSGDTYARFRISTDNSLSTAPSSIGTLSDGEVEDYQITIGSEASLGVAKTVGNVTDNRDGSYNVAFTITIENLGDVDLNNLQVTDDLTVAFPNPSSYVMTSSPTPINPAPGATGALSVNPSFDGDGNTNLLLGTETLAVGETKSLGFVIRVTPDNPNLTYFNQAFGEANGGAVTDPSHNGTDPDPDGNSAANETDNNDPTPIQFASQSKLGVAKTASNLAAQGDGTYNVTYTIKLENMGNVPIDNLQINDDLVAVFRALDCSSPTTSYCVVAGSIFSSDFTINPAFNGDPSGTTPSDDELLFGNSNSLNIGESGSLEFIVNFNPNGQTEFCNSATGFIDTINPDDDTLDAGEINDMSTDGSDPDSDGDGNPSEQTPTCITIPSNEEIGLAKSTRSISDNQGTNTDPVYLVLFEMKVENSGDVPLENVQVTDNLVTTFEKTKIGMIEYTTSEISSFSIVSGPTVSNTTSNLQENPSYDGDSDINLLTGIETLDPGESATISFTVRIMYNTIDPDTVDNREFGTFYNQGTASGSAPDGTVVTDDSHDGGIADPEGDGPSDNSAPTPIDFGPPLAGPNDFSVQKSVKVCGTIYTGVAACDSAAGVYKTVASANPKEYLIYKIVGTNDSASGIIDEVKLLDEILAPTVFVAATVSTNGTTDGGLEVRCSTSTIGIIGVGDDSFITPPNCVSSASSVKHIMVIDKNDDPDTEPDTGAGSHGLQLDINQTVTLLLVVYIP